MRRPNEPIAEDLSGFPDIDPQNKRPRSRHRAWRDGLAAQTIIENLEDGKSYRSFERAIVASLVLDLSSSLSSFVGWPPFSGDFVAPTRSKRASLRSTANFRLRAGRARPTGLANQGRLQPPLVSMAIAKGRDRTDETIRRPPANNRRPRPRAASSASLILTRRCLRGWAPTKPGSGGTPHK
jgi:hypothetical protein